jgi:hypothetical protein
MHVVSFPIRGAVRQSHFRPSLEFVSTGPMVFRGDGLEQAEPAKTNHQFLFRANAALACGISDRTMNWSVMCFQSSSIAESLGNQGERTT